MPVHVWTVLCARSIIDVTTKQVSILDVVEKVVIHNVEPGLFQLDISQVPEGRQAAIKHQLGLVSWWVREDYEQPETAFVRLRIHMPGGKAAEMATFEVELEETTGFRLSGTLPGIPWGGFGLYWIAIEQREANNAWKEVARIPLELELKEEGKSSTPETDAPAPPPEPTPAPSPKPKRARRVGKRK